MQTSYLVRSALGLLFLTFCTSISAQQDTKFEDHLQEGFKQAKLRNWDKAVEAFSMAVELDPKSAEAQRNLGASYLNLGRCREALGPLETAIGLEPLNPASHFYKGTCMISLRRVDEAYDSLTEALRLDPKNPQVHNMLGLWMSNAGRFEDAIRSYRTSAELLPNDPANYHNIGLMYMRIGRFQEAIEPLEKAVSIQPGYRSAWFHLSGAFSRTFRFKDAAESWRKVSELDPSSPLAVSNIAWNYLYDGSSGMDAARYAEIYLERFGWKTESSPFMAMVAILGYRSYGLKAEAEGMATRALEKCDRGVCGYTLIRFHPGEIDADKLMELAVDNNKKTEANAYIGMDLKLRGETDKAREHFEWVSKFGNVQYFEHLLALAELRRSSK